MSEPDDISSRLTAAASQQPIADKTNPNQLVAKIGITTSRIVSNIIAHHTCTIEDGSIFNTLSVVSRAQQTNAPFFNIPQSCRKIWDRVNSCVLSGSTPTREHAHFRLAMLYQEIPDTEKANIAEAYLDADDAATALEWMKRIPARKAKSDVWNYDSLMLKIHQSLGNSKEASKIALRDFRQFRSEHAFEKLLSVIGKDKRETIIEQEVSIVHQTKAFVPEDALFLIQGKRMNDAEQYVLKRAKQLDGDQYYSLSEIATALHDAERFLAATMVYRALLDSILIRKQSRAYHHGADYLNALESMSTKILEWNDTIPHERYINELRAEHGRKYSFWNQFRD